MFLDQNIVIDLTDDDDCDSMQVECPSPPPVFESEDDGYYTSADSDDEENTGKR